MRNKQKIILGRNGVVSGKEPCLSLPKVNGRYIVMEDVFDLYCSECGKPHNLICFYQLHHWIDLEVLQWRREVNGKRLPKYLSSVLRTFDTDTGEGETYN